MCICSELAFLHFNTDSCTLILYGRSKVNNKNLSIFSWILYLFQYWDKLPMFLLVFVVPMKVCR